MKSDEKIDLKFAKRSKKLPIVLTKNKIIKIIDNISNQKYHLAVSLSYAGGLRISEIQNLKVKDLNIEELTIHIKNAKGKKDRITIFPEKLKNDFQNLIAGKKLNDFVFGSNRGGKLTTHSFQAVFKKALQKAVIKKRCYFSFLATFVCYAFTWEWNRCALCARASRALQYPHNTTVHASDQSKVKKYKKSIIKTIIFADPEVLNGV